jgi:NADH-quinone oxidoreductase subunit L
MFHLIAHAFFKALLFMGAGSVIHGCHEEQDVRCMGGLRKFMPLTFATYAVGMLALAGFPLLFSGFWSKDEILHAAHGWNISRWPFYLGLLGALLTAFYMTRQVALVFFGSCRLALGRTTASEQHTVAHGGVSAKEHPHVELPSEPHESPTAMTIPLVILAGFSIVLGFIGTPAWPWFQDFINGGKPILESGRLFEGEFLGLLATSSIVVFAGLGLGWWFYGRTPAAKPQELDPLERIRPDVFALLRSKYFVDELYEATFIRFNAWMAKACDWLDAWIWGGLVHALSYVIVGLSWVNRVFDEYVVNLGFDEGCQGMSEGGRFLSRLQNGRVQNYLRVLGVGLTAFVLFLVWGCRG